MQSTDLTLELNDESSGNEKKLERQIAEFKADPERMKSANEFVNELLEKAQKEALLKENLKMVMANPAYVNGRTVQGDLCPEYSRQSATVQNLQDLFHSLQNPHNGDCINGLSV